MVNKRLLVGVGCMLVGGALFVTGLTQMPGLPIVLILIGGALGFVGYRIFESRRSDKPKGMEYGR